MDKTAGDLSRHVDRLASFATEDLFPLTEAADLLPRRNGKKIHRSTLYRWALNGIHGVVLKTVRIGRTIYTSQEALTRFLQQTSDPSLELPPTKARQQEQDQVDRRVAHRLSGRARRNRRWP